jgi:hypothetical protein
MIMQEKARFLFDNALLYKDITQWLRRRLFGYLYFGLLILAEFITLLVGFFSVGSQETGKDNFYALFSVLCIYAVVIALVGYKKISDEYLNQTFDLYIITGLTNQKMVLGMLFSMFGQFLFGFFCIVPFLFFSYFMGGLDFILIITMLVNVCMWVIPFYLVCIMFAFFKSAWLKVGVFFLALFCMPTPFFWFIAAYGRLIYGIMEDPTFFTLIINGIALVLLYGVVCVFLFFICSAVIYPSNSTPNP